MLVMIDSLYKYVLCFEKIKLNTKIIQGVQNLSLEEGLAK